MNKGKQTEVTAAKVVKEMKGRRLTRDERMRLFLDFIRKQQQKV